MNILSRLGTIIVGIFFIVLAAFLISNPVANLTALSFWLSIFLLISSISAIIGYFGLPQRYRHGIFLFKFIINLLIAIYLLASGAFVALPIAIPMILGIVMIVDAVFMFFGVSKIGLLAPVIGSGMKWVAVLMFIIGLLLLIEPLGAAIGVLYVLAFGFFLDGISHIVQAFSSRKED